jgi:Lrp/AsnC family transcriptional regulator, leucine-responsive regulatory protein
MIDGIDDKILKNLQENARISNAEIARRVGLAPSAVLERIRRLERDGVVLGYTARIAPAAVGRGTLAFVFVQAESRPFDRSLGEQLAAIPEVLEVHEIAGEDCLLVKLRCASNEALGRLLQQRIGSLPEVRRTRTTIALATVRESSALRPLAEVGGPGGVA